MARWLRAALITGAVAAAWIAVLPRVSARQPLAFPHAKHTTVGCAVCHRGAATAARAGIPDAPTCAKCHASAPGGSPQAWSAAIARGTLGWVRVTHMPDHVMFSHRRHVTLGRIACESCHGAMRDRPAPVGIAPVRLDMKTCLSCHRTEGAAEDCAACHR